MTTSGNSQDFGDWISPILVKELRQGLRTRVFTIAFIAVQTILLLFLFAGMWGSSDTEFVSGAFWTLLFFVLVVITPLRGLGMLSSEVSQNTLDLLSLTRLTALRICLGKWAALFTQALLFAIAALPYVVIRYFAGGIDLLLELQLLAGALAGSAVLCALSITSSSLTHNLSRKVLLVIFALFFSMGAGPLWFGVSLGRGSPPPLLGNPWAWTIALLSTAYFTFFFISAAASRIAPAAENYSTTRRLVSLAAIAVCLTLVLAKDDEFLAMAYPLVVLLAIDVLTEPSTSLASVHARFLRFGSFIGRPLQFLLAPGWHSGSLLLSLVIAATGTVATHAQTTPYPLRMLSVHLSLAGLFLLPVLITEMFLKSFKDRFAPYLFVQAGQLALGGFFLMLREGGGVETLPWLGSLLPATSFFMALNNDYQDKSQLTLVAAASFALLLAGLIYAGRAYYRAITAQGRQEPADPDQAFR